MKPLLVITGGTKGLGREIALVFGQAGYPVLALYSSDEAAARKLDEAFLEANIKGFVAKHDVTEDDDAVWSHPSLASAEGLILINNACAPFTPLPFHQYRWPDFEALMAVAVKGTWHCSRALLRPMLKLGKGMIINVTTAALDQHAPKGFSAYVTAKHALRGLTLALAAEYSARGIRVCTISPGFMNTALTEKWDVRLRDAIQAHSKRMTHTRTAALRLVQMIENDEIIGAGEDYPL